MNGCFWCNKIPTSKTSFSVKPKIKTINSINYCYLDEHNKIKRGYFSLRLRVEQKKQTVGEKPQSRLWLRSSSKTYFKSI